MYEGVLTLKMNITFFYQKLYDEYFFIQKFFGEKTYFERQPSFLGAHLTSF